MPTKGIRIVNETNLGSFSLAKDDVGSPDYDGLGPVTLNNVFLMENIEPGKGPGSPNSKTFVNLDAKNWHGGYSTIVTPTTCETPIFAEIQSNMVGPRRRGGRRSVIKEEELSPEEEERLRQRRERNKEAAARCRKRRVDQTETLQSEVDSWEEKKRLLQEEIHALQTQKEELQFILDAHRTVCNRRPAQPAPVTSPPQQQPQQHQQPLLARRSHVLNVPKVVVKTEEEVVDSNTYEILHLTHEEVLDLPCVRPIKPARPASLSLTIKPQCLRFIEGVPIETPTNVFSSLNFDALMDGRTGLTPTNILTPVCVTMTSLQTPVVTTPSCSSQQWGKYLVSPGGSKFKLVSL